MKVVYVGYSKCGTSTMAKCFHILGYKCYDVLENFGFHGDDWVDIIKNGATKEKFIRMYSDVDAACDLPVFHFWEDILDAFPQTKFLVWYREEESWLKSYKYCCNEVCDKDRKFQLLTMLSPTAQKFVRKLRFVENQMNGADLQAWPWQYATNASSTLLRKRYRMHNLYVQQKIPKDKLHIVDFKQGWEPICEFLGKPVPDVPFPHINKNSNLYADKTQLEMFSRMKTEAAFTAFLIIFLLSVFLHYVFA